MPPTPPYILRIVINSRQKVDASFYSSDFSMDSIETNQSLAYEEQRDLIQTLQSAAREAARTGRELTAAQSLGEALYDTLFGSLGNWFVERYRKIREQSACLRIEIQVDIEDNLPPNVQTRLAEIASLPWEFLYARGDALSLGLTWLATAPDLVLARRLARRFAPPPIQLKAGEKLTVALAVSSPTNAYFDADLGDEITLGEVKYLPISDILANLVSAHRGLIAPARLTFPATLDAVRQSLKQGPSIFHFIGHARINPARNIPEVALTRPGGFALPEWVAADVFCAALAAAPPRIVLLQACESAASSAGHAFDSIAARLAALGIPVVIAMQYEVSNISAVKFAETFYTTLLKEKCPVDRAVQEGRLAIHGSRQRPDFATPVIFLWKEDNSLFPRLPAVVDAYADQSSDPLFNAISVLNYDEVVGKFQTYLNRHTQQCKAAALVINATSDFTWRWIVNRLARMIPSAVAPPSAQNFGCKFNDTHSFSPATVWKEIASRSSGKLPADLTVGSGSRSYPDYLVSDVLGEQSVYVLLKKVPRMLVKDLLTDFWLPLLNSAATRNPPAPGWLVLFLVVESENKAGYFSARDLPEGVPAPLILSLEDNIDEEDFNEWYLGEKEILSRLAVNDPGPLPEFAARILGDGSDLYSVVDQLTTALLGTDIDKKEQDWLILR
jgi:hypothetical protein